jgi:hypothetical protein
MSGARIVWLAAVLAALSRLPGLLWPLRPDEAGFLLVARSWDPQPDSVYGTYWVDRPPQIIWLMRALDQLGGPYFHRIVGALACALLVLAAAAAAREIARSTPWSDPRLERRAALVSAILAAALVSNAEIDPVGAKGELFALPLVMVGAWLALRAVRLGSWPAAAAGALCAVLAVGLKQSMVGGLVLGGAVLIGARVTGQVDRRTGWKLITAATVAALVPVVATVGWALSAGVGLDTLWYTVATFRSDASSVLADEQSDAAVARAGLLALLFLGTGMGTAVLWLLIRGHRALQHLPVPGVPVLMMFSVDLAMLALSGSYWKPYLFALIPGITLSLACLVSAGPVAAGPVRRTWRPRLTNAVVGIALLSSVVSMAVWVGAWAKGVVHYEVRTGSAIAAASGPEDSLIVYGGRADIQWASGLPSPYQHLWSLPMRTLDPERAELRAILSGPDAPSWFVEAAPLSAWAYAGSEELDRLVEQRYEQVAIACDRFPIHRLRTAPAVDFDIDCSTPARGLFGGNP